MNRSRPAVRQAIKFLHEGGIGKVYMARGLCFKPRPGDRQVSRRPDAAGEQYKLNVESRRRRADLRRGLPRRRSTTTCGSARRRSGRSTATASTTTGTGTGTTATATPATRGRTSSTSRAGACSKNEHPVKITLGRRLLRARGVAGDARTSRPRLFEYADGTVLEFATRGSYTNDEGTQKIGNLFYGTKGWLWIDGDGRKWQSYLGRKDEKGPGSDGAGRAAAAATRACSPASSTRTTRTSSTPSAPAIRSC